MNIELSNSWFSVAEGDDDGDDDGGDYGGDGGDDLYPAYNQGDVGQDLQEVEEDVSDDEENDLVVLDPEHVSDVIYNMIR